MTFTITTHAVVVALCWIAGLAFAIADIFLVPDWAALSTGFIVMGATLMVRRRVDQYAADWTRAYEAGRGAEDQEVRKIR